MKKVTLNLTTGKFSTEKPPWHKGTADVDDHFYDKCSGIDITAQVRQLAASDRGQRALTTLRAFIQSNYIGLDERNQDAVMKMLICASNSPSSTMDAINEELE